MRFAVENDFPRELEQFDRPIENEATIDRIVRGIRSKGESNDIIIGSNVSIILRSLSKILRTREGNINPIKPDLSKIRALFLVSFPLTYTCV